MGKGSDEVSGAALSAEIDHGDALVLYCPGNFS